MEKRILETDGYINKAGEITRSGLEILIKSELLRSNVRKPKVKIEDSDVLNISKLREMFPPMMFPSGSQARGSLRDMTERFSWFKANHPEFNNWDLIFKATEQYLRYYKDRDWEFASTSSYFISKNEKKGNFTKSILAEYCQKITDVGMVLVEHETTSFGIIKGYNPENSIINNN